MDSDTMRSLKRQLKSDFVGYKVKRVANHITTMTVVYAGILHSCFRKLGFNYGKVKQSEIKFSHHCNWLRTRTKFYGAVYENKYKVNCAVDEIDKVVYWNYECIKREFTV